MNPEPLALRSGDWKLVLDSREDHDRETDSKPALSLLRDDPSESKDLSAEHPERVAKLSARLEELQAKIVATPILPISE